jgi:hypothetical protein
VAPLAIDIPPFWSHWAHPPPPPLFCCPTTMICCVGLPPPAAPPSIRYYLFTMRFFQLFLIKKLTTSCLCCTDVVHRRLEIHSHRLHSTLRKKQMQRRGCSVECESSSQRPGVGTTLRPNSAAAHGFLLGAFLTNFQGTDGRTLWSSLTRSYLCGMVTYLGFMDWAYSFDKPLPPFTSI